jgi:hypothetical protein
VVVVGYEPGKGARADLAHPGCARVRLHYAGEVAAAWMAGRSAAQRSSTRTGSRHRWWPPRIAAPCRAATGGGPSSPNGRTTTRQAAYKGLRSGAPGGPRAHRHRTRVEEAEAK